ncbi:MAG: hypothetical protein EOM66_12690 [Clostridia bacterium]|nr:hypothetical protein [Clostridia bacterium]
MKVITLLLCLMLATTIIVNNTTVGKKLGQDFDPLPDGLSKHYEPNGFMKYQHKGVIDMNKFLPNHLWYKIPRLTFGSCN